jgi:anthranilate phosphoribosyltransferase
MISEALQRLVNHRESLSREEARCVMSEILSGRATDAQIAGILVALSLKGESVDEIVGFAEAIRAASAPLPVSATLAVDLVDTCGTGGDARGTFNISTATALVLAGGGVKVAKHGNRSITSRCGSADVMEALGVNLGLTPECLGACLEQVGFAFLFAPTMHSAIRFVQPARRELKIRTVFNLLGPLTNPAGASVQILGVYAPELVQKLAEALRLLGLRTESGRRPQLPDPAGRVWLPSRFSAGNRRR